jgi:hypothetical protein
MRNKLFILLSLTAFLLGCEKESNELLTVDVTSVTLNMSEVTLFKGDSCVLVANVLPDNATDKKVKWQSDKPETATVSSTGVIKGINAGNAVITASAGGIQSQCKVTVLKGIDFSFGHMSTDAPVIHGKGGSTTISITASGEWTLTSNSSWLTISPSSGQAGTYSVTIETAKNSTGKDREGVISLSPGSQSQSLSICQRPYIYERSQVASGNITNAVKLTYTGTEWSRIYTILPYPTSNLYQDIKSVDIYGATKYDCPDSVNSYILTDLTGNEVPASGKNVIMESINIVAYEVTAKIGLIDNIPPYDNNSLECQKYLGKEEGDLVDPTNSSVISVANSLWKDSEGNLIDYARRCYEWTAKNMSYGNMNTGLHTITELMHTKKGDCGNFSSVFISLLRAKGIPARHIVMISPQESGYHVRAEFYIPAYGWIPADPTFKNSNPSGDFFGKFTGKYVVMSLGVNSIIKDSYGNDFTASLLQTYFYWYWWYNEGSNLKFEHIFSKFN